jgi:hypothetical protein
LKAIFLIKGGEESWLIDGVEGVDEKLGKLSKINNILAHQPWKLNRMDIEVKCNLILGNNSIWE